ncbi:nuclear transport factor 2 family protein [Cecembia rubra]|uniref:nuclear transport factor 2 family protein n=1 Tax=Cecembia rubra TaxID=1485585 RepID=UPI0027148177|nr:nuclear transport factor 2 family protein [Cecembia rubra]
MKKQWIILPISFLISILVSAQTMQEKEIIELDLAWEKALLESDVAFLENILADDFIWVHNHAGLIDGKSAVVSRAKRIQQGQDDNTKGRVSRDQKAIIMGKTAVVSGFTVVERGPSLTTYHFMRTYVKVKKGFKLLANQTMAIPDEDELK